VRFPGAIPDSEKRLLFAASDIHLMPSVQRGNVTEGFGIVFLEAAAAGIPSVCGKAGGQPEAVRHMQTGIVANGEDLNDVAAAVRRLASDSGLRLQLGEQGRAWAAEHAWDRVVERTRSVIQNALQG
jgi:phosphatidylinositol alpha-1,6-mannosyltransferase